LCSQSCSRQKRYPVSGEHDRQPSDLSKKRRILAAIDAIELVDEDILIARANEGSFRGRSKLNAPGSCGKKYRGIDGTSVKTDNC
jgi:hypothetical protein